MNGELPALRVLWARWCAAAAIAGAMADGGLALPVDIVVDGRVARYRAASGAGATLARFGADRAVLSCGDLGWRVAGSPSAALRVAALPDWVDHVSMLDHRVRVGHFSWVAVHQLDGWSAVRAPDGAPLPPMDTAGLAGLLGAALGPGQAQRDLMFHLLRMAEYQDLDRTSWRTALGAVLPADATERGWETLREHDLIRLAGRGPVTVGVRGRSAADAETIALDYARRIGRAIPEDVRVGAGFRREHGWDFRYIDYRDADTGTALIIAVDDDDSVHVR
jgi:hypothetical protein